MPCAGNGPGGRARQAGLSWIGQSLSCGYSGRVQIHAPAIPIGRSAASIHGQASVANAGAALATSAAEAPHFALRAMAPRWRQSRIAGPHRG